MKKSWIWKIIGVLLLGGLVLMGHGIWCNQAIVITEYDLKYDSLPEELEGLRITQISDFHNTVFADDNQKFYEMIEQTRPNLIVLTGDLVDFNRTDIEVAVEFARRILQIAPCYYVPGNHEARIGERYATLEKGLREVGVHVLRNEVDQYQYGDAYIQLIGVDDPEIYSVEEMGLSEAMRMKGRLDRLMENTDGFCILLSHRPELFEVYSQYAIDVVFTGHAHGGQIQIPWLGGVIAPNQGFFPEYDQGIFIQDGTAMLISRGIGNSVIPIRVNNRPEIVCVELHIDEE